MIEIFGADWCGPCRLTKGLCEKHNLEFKFHDISVEPEGLAIVKEKLGKEPSTIPQVFVDGKHIGGYTDFQEYVKTI